MKGYKVKQVQFFKGQQIGASVQSCYPHKPDQVSEYDMVYHPACGVFFEPLKAGVPFLISQAVIERITFEKLAEKQDKGKLS